MKINQKILSLILVVFLGVFITSCKTDKTYSITFDPNGGVFNKELVVEVKKGSLLAEPDEPTKKNYNFLGWFTSNDEGKTLAEKWEFEINKVEKSITLYAKWEGDVKIMVSFEHFLNENNPVVTIMVKDFGTMKVQLFPEVAENTVNNFINYVLENKYDGSTFHRVIATFMIQGGAVSKTNKPIKGEFKNNGVNNRLLHDRGVISMARTTVADSATSQFFIMHEKSPHLDGLYAAFGVLVEGFDVLDMIANVKTNGYPYDGPLQTITIESVTINLNGYEPKEVIYK